MIGETVEEMFQCDHIPEGVAAGAFGLLADTDLIINRQKIVELL